MGDIYRLPFGGETVSFRRYAREWRRLGKGIEKILKPAGYVLAGFDPSLMFLPKYGSAIYLPPTAAKLILDAVKKGDR